MADSTPEDSGGAGRFACAETVESGSGSPSQEGKRGTYTPTSGTDRDATFPTKYGVAIYGEVDPGVGRNWQVFAGGRSRGQTDLCYTG